MKSLTVNDKQKQPAVEAAQAALDHKLMNGLLLLLPGCFHANNIAGDGKQQQQQQQHCNMIGAASSTGVAGQLAERAYFNCAVCVTFSNYRYGNSNGKKHHHGAHYIRSISGNICNNQVVVGGDLVDDWCD